MPKASSYLYGSDLERRAQRGLIDEVSFNEQKVQFDEVTDNKSNIVPLFDRNGNIHSKGTFGMIDLNRNLNDNATRKRLGDLTEAELINKLVAQQNNRLPNDVTHGRVYHTQKPLERAKRNVSEGTLIEGADNVVFKITSDRVISKINEIKNDYPGHYDMLYPDIRVNVPLSLTVPVLSNTQLTYTGDYKKELPDFDKRKLLDYPSELVDIKAKVLVALLLEIRPPFGEWATQERIDQLIQDLEVFWEGAADKYSTIELISVQHVVIPSNVIHDMNLHAKSDLTVTNRPGLPGRFIFDFIINSQELANLISSPELSNRITSPKMNSLPDIPIQSELELRIPGRISNPFRPFNPAIDLEKSLLMALGIPENDLTTIDPQSFSITSTDFVIGS